MASMFSGMPAHTPRRSTPSGSALFLPSPSVSGLQLLQQVSEFLLIEPGVREIGRGVGARPGAAVLDDVAERLGDPLGERRDRLATVQTPGKGDGQLQTAAD